MNVIISGRGVKVTSGIRSKIDEIFSKHKEFLDVATKIEVELKESQSHAGVDTDLSVEVTAVMPKATIRVVETGRDFYTIIDEIDPILRRRLRRYNAKQKQWEGKRTWKVLQREKFEKEISEIKEDVYADSIDITPRITRYKQFSRNSPMHPAEAIERMELLGHEAFLFKSIKTRKYSVVYKRYDGTYGLLEPRDV